MGYVNNVPELLNIADLVVTKPGGATVTECLYFNVPMLFIGKHSGQEKANCKYLEKQGVQILERNYRCKMGEIDIIGRQGDCFIFFEVKYRKSEEFGQALSFVDYKKQRTICRCVAAYCMKHTYITQFRYDVIGITDTKIEWIQNAFCHSGYGFY